jgi:hypothetical protein
MCSPHVERSRRHDCWQQADQCRAAMMTDRASVDPRERAGHGDGGGGSPTRRVDGDGGRWPMKGMRWPTMTQCTPAAQRERYEEMRQ